MPLPRPTAIYNFQEKIMWTKPTFKDIRLGFEVTCYVLLK
nr:MAG: pyrroloquinoline quinone biosynthesis protein A [Caudoviricetes sp.]